MPSGNIQRSIQSFVSTVISSSESNSSAPSDSSNPRGNIRTSRRTIGSGSWIVNDLNSAQQQIQQALEAPLEAIYTGPSIFQGHSRQSTGAEVDFDFQDAAYLHPQVLSSRNAQQASSTVQSQSSEIIDSYFDNEMGSGFNNNAQFDVTDLNQAGVPLQQLHQILRGAAGIQNNVGINPSATTRSNNALRNKIVYKLNCAYCKIPVCDRGMRAILLADTKVELFSTDIPPKAVVTMNEDKMASGCNCRIRDTVCSGCGNVLGYHVSQPCDRCLDARNNGHFWMFCSEGITSTERMHYDGNGPLYWAALSPMCDFVPASSYVAPGQSGNSGYESFCR